MSQARTRARSASATRAGPSGARRSSVLPRRYQTSTRHPPRCDHYNLSIPQDCKSFRIGSSCCEFICLDDEPGGSGGDSVVWDRDLGLRLLATTVTALLSLALLAFLLHRVLKKSRWSTRRRRNRSACNEDEADGGPTSSLASYEHHGDLTSSVGHLSRFQDLF